MRLSRILALVLRYLYIYRRSKLRSFEMVFWPMMELLIWGFLSSDLSRYTNSQGMSYLIGGMILWDILFRAQQGVAMFFLQEMWVGNLLNVFIAPLRTRELMAGACLVGLFRSGVTLVILSILAWLLYTFNVLQLQFGMVLCFSQLLIFGWAIGMITTAIIIKYGEAAETLAWAIPFMLQPFCAVFYPVASLPQSIQYVASAIPATWAFEAMRATLIGGSIDTTKLAVAVGLNLVFLIAAAAYMGLMIEHARIYGYLTRSIRN